MQIKRLRLTGFKSFVEPTELRIEPGLTGVVGPNGCGKSNLLEAIRRERSQLPTEHAVARLPKPFLRQICMQATFVMLVPPALSPAQAPLLVAAHLLAMLLVRPWLGLAQLDTCDDALRFRLDSGRNSAACPKPCLRVRASQLIF